VNLKELNMKRLALASLIALSAGFVAVGTSFAADDAGTIAGGAFDAGDAASGIGQSRHNLGSLGNKANTSFFTSTGTSEICVFCHTPHHTSTTGAGPLWNRGASQTSFTAYSTTIAGTPVAAPGAGSLACLSCHDGTTTFDNIANKPGKGLGGSSIGASGDQNWYFFKDNSALQTNTASDDEIGNSSTSRLNVGGTNSSGISNDHPVGVTYSGGTKASLRQTSLTISNISVSADLASSAGTFDDGNLAQNRWAVNGFISSTASIADLLRGGLVECTTCHDPHFRNRSWTEAETVDAYTDGMFLRRVGGNAGSGVCRTCHEK